MTPPTQNPAVRHRTDSERLEDIIKSFAPLAGLGRRYPVTRGEHGCTRYGPWTIYFDPPPIPTRAFDWHFYHEDYDGAPDANDSRCGACASFAAALNECDAMEDDQ